MPKAVNFKIHTEKGDSKNTCLCCAPCYAICQNCRRILCGKQFNPLTEGGGVFIYIRLPPDKGVSWLMLVVSFLTMAVSDGILASVGVILSGISETLKVSIAKVTIINSLQLIFVFAISPFASAAVNKFGFRATAFMSALLTAVAYVAATFYVDLIFLYITLGFVVGACQGAVTTIATLVVGYYFEKYRALSMGICTSGTGVGTLVVSQLTNYVTENYGWKRTLHVYAIMSMTIGFLTLIYRAVEPKEVRKLEFAGTSSVDTMISGLSVELGSNRYSSYVESFHYVPAIIPSYLGKRPDTPLPPPLAVTTKKKKSKCCEIFCSKCCKKRKNEAGDKPVRVIVDPGPMYREDILYQGSLIDVGGQSIHFKKTSFDDSDEFEVTSVQYLNEKGAAAREKKRRNYKCKICTCPTAIRDILGIIFDVSIMKIPAFQILILSGFLFCSGYYVVFLFLVPRSKIPTEYANFLITAIGIFGVIFRLASGIISFRVRSVHPAFIVGCPATASGTICLYSALYGHNQVWFQFLFAVIFALGTAFYFAQRSILYVNALGLQKLTNAFGLCSLAMGFGASIGVVIGGVLVDLTGNYDATFMFAGATLTIASIMVCYLPIIQRHEDKRSRSLRTTIQVLRKK